jgi:DNA-binding beta-propeller fold protein YncE
LREPVAIRLAVDPPGFVDIPESVVILPGALEVFIPLRQVQAEPYRGATLATVSATSPGFVATAARMEVRDDRIRSLQLAVADLLVHPTSGLLYATVAARDPNFPNSVAEVDPVLGNVLRHVAVGPDPVPLALTRDGLFLYVGMHGDGTVRRVRLDTMEAEQPFSLEGYLALALVTLPDQPGAVAVNRHAVNTGQDISVYLNGVRQPGDLPIGTLWASDFTAGPGDLAFIGVPERQRLKLATTGITAQASAPGEFSPVGWRYADGRLYANDGRVFSSDNFQPLPSILDIAQGSVHPEPERQRVYYLGNGEFRNGTQPGLGIVEADLTLGIAGEPTVFPRAQTHTSLVRWGQAGLAFGADDSLHLIETVAVPSGPPVHLILSGPPTLHGVSGDVAAWNLTISNAGPTSATSLRLLGSHDTHLSLVSIEVTQGTGASRNGGFEWLPGHLAPGETAHATVLFRPNAAGEFPVGAVVRSLQPDSHSNDNRLVAVLRSQLRLGPDSIGQLAVPARGLAFDPASRRLAVSVADGTGTQGGDRLLIVNPATSEIEASHPTGPRPGRLALAANGQAIWVAIDGKALLQRFDLSTRTFGAELPRYPTPMVPAPVPREIWDIAPLPGQPERVVASFKAGESDIDAVLLDPAGPVGPGIPMALAVEASPDGTRLYVQQASTQTFQTLEARPEGLRIVDTRPGLFSGLALALMSDRVYTADGRILDVASLTELGRLNLAGSIATQILPLPSLDRLVFYTPGMGLQVFQLSSRRLLGTIDLPLYVTEMDALIHVGDDSLVLTSRDDGGKVTFVRTGLLPTEPPADLGIQVSPAVEFVRSGSFAGLRIEVTNAGPHPARRVRVAMPSIGFGGSVESAMGTFAYHDHTGLDGLVETLDPHQSIVLTVRIPTGDPGRVAAPVRTWSASADSVSTNNFAVTSLGVFAPPQLDINLPFAFPAAGLVVHPDGTKLFATIPPDQPLAAAGLGIFEILPGEGKISGARPAGNQPGILGITADGSRLWVVTDQGRMLRRLRIDDWVWEREVPLPDTGPITRVVTAPSGHDRLAILRYNRVDIVTGDTVRSLPVEITPVGAATFSDDGERLWVARSRSDFPYDTGWLQAFSLRNTDFGAVLGESPRDSHTTSLRAAAGRLYLDGGAVTDPITLEPLPNLAVPGAPMPFPELDRVVYAQRDGGASPTFLRAIDPAGTREVETQQLCCFYNLDGPELVGRWGIDGIVLRTPQTFYLYRSSLLPAREGLDFDGDSLTDSWERAHGFNPHDPTDAVLDPDADGASNLDEWLAGTSPLDPGSTLRLRIVAGPAPGLRLHGVVGRRYLPEVAPTVQGPWSAAGDAVGGAGEDLVFPVEGFSTPPARFFRIRLLQP